MTTDASKGVMWAHEQPVLLKHLACKEGQEHPYQYPGTGNSVDGLSRVQGIIEEDLLLQDKQHNSSGPIC